MDQERWGCSELKRGSGAKAPAPFSSGAAAEGRRHSVQGRGSRSSASNGKEQKGMDMAQGWGRRRQEGRRQKHHRPCCSGRIKVQRFGSTRQGQDRRMGANKKEKQKHRQKEQMDHHRVSKGAAKGRKKVRYTSEDRWGV